MLQDPRPYFQRPWFFGKTALWIFAGLLVLFMGLGALSVNELYQKELKHHADAIRWEYVLKPLWVAPGIVVLIYLCCVGFWLIFRLREYRAAQFDHMTDRLRAQRDELERRYEASKKK